jgi:hypothetical protein
MAVVGGVGHVWGASSAPAVKLLEDQLQVWLPKPDRHQRQLRGHRLRHPLVLLLKYAPTACGHRRGAPQRRAPEDLDAPPLPVRDSPARRAGARRAGGAQAASAAWSPSTTSASRSAPGRSSG